MTSAKPATALQRLAESYGVQTSYEDVTGKRREATPEALVAVLRALGAPLGKVADAADARRQREQALWRRVVEPVLLAWDGNPGEVSLRLPARLADQPLDCRLELESGEV